MPPFFSFSLELLYSFLLVLENDSVLPDYGKGHLELAPKLCELIH